ncbi:hypothetical protein HOY82DRAFT_559356 [Tuber indicum]|nr:hypothetical protein HOY82DRAFT_559356 [Tuber indicum]
MPASRHFDCCSPFRYSAIPLLLFDCCAILSTNHRKLFGCFDRRRFFIVLPIENSSPFLWFLLVQRTLRFFAVRSV